MIEKIPGAGVAENTVPSTEQPLRFAYNPSRQTFTPMQTQVKRNIDHMTKIGKQVGEIKVPTDYTSPAFLRNVKTLTAYSAQELETDTQGVNVQSPRQLILSVQKANRKI